MEADWEVEIGPSAPLIEGNWPGFLDLRQSPNEVNQLSETQQLIGLAAALNILNLPDSPVWTSKCDVWTVAPGEFDGDELDADPSSAHCAMACYIDLLPSNDEEWSLPEKAIASCEWLCSCLRQVALSNCRVDLIVRGACVAPEAWSHGITVYVTACGPTVPQANGRLSVALRALVRYLHAQYNPAPR